MDGRFQHLNIAELCLVWLLVNLVLEARTIVEKNLYEGAKQVVEQLRN